MKMGVYEKIKERIKDYIRVLKIARKPDINEFKTVAKVTAIGLSIIGMIGFILQLLNQLLKQLM